MTRPKLGIFAAVCASLLSACGNGGSEVRATGSASPEATQQAVNAFVQACVNTSATPGGAAVVLANLGFQSAGERNGFDRFVSSYATAAVSSHSDGNGVGQCSVTPIDQNGATIRPILAGALGSATVATRFEPNLNSWIVPSTSSGILINAGGGTMTRTQSGAFSG